MRHIEHESFKAIIDAAETPVLLLVVSENCEENTPVMQYHLENMMAKHPKERAVLHSLCIPEVDMPFPRPATPTLFYFLPKNHTPVFWRHNTFLSKLEQDLQVVYKMMKDKTTYREANLTPAEYEKFKTIEKFLEDEKAVLSSYPVDFQESRKLARETWEQAKRSDRKLPILSTIRVGYRRYAECQKCEKYDKSVHRCGECLCFMRIRTHLEAEKCPLGKW